MTGSDASPSPRLPLIPLGVWAVLVLAYPVWLLGSMLSSDSLGLTLPFCPDVVLYGLLRLPVVLVSAALWGIAIGAGMALVRLARFGDLTIGERVVFGGALGTGILSLATFAIGTISGSRRWLLTLLVVAFLVGLAALGLRDLIRAVREGFARLRGWRSRGRAREAILLGLGAAIVLFALTRANVPVVTDYDSLEYHLAAPAQWWRAGRIFFIRDVVYANFPQNTEMLYLLAMTVVHGPLLGAVVGQQLGIGFVLLTAGAIACCGRRLGSEAAGQAGAALFLATPMLPGLATLDSYVVELPQAAYSFLALYAFLLLRRAAARQSRWRYAGLCGALIGLAIGCKYPVVLFVLAPILAFLVAGGVLRPRTLARSVAEAAIVGAAAVALASPWLVRNAVNTGNPTYPLLYHTFGGDHWTEQQDAKFAKAHGQADARLMDLAPRFLRFALWRDQPKGFDGPPWRPPPPPLLLLLAIIPIALGDIRSVRPVFYLAIAFLAAAAVDRFWPRSSRMVLLLAAGALALVTSPAFLLRRGDLLFLALHLVWWLMAWHALTHRIDRFLDPATPQLALLAGFGVAALGGLPRRFGNWAVVAGLAFALATTVLIHTGLTGAGLALSTNEFLRSFARGTYCQPAMEVINTKLPPDATVLFVGEARTFYCERRVLAATVFDRHPVARLLALDDPGGPAKRVRDGLRDLGVTHLYVNWPEARRLGGSYAYHFDGELRDGFTDRVIPKPGEKPSDKPIRYITPELFGRMVGQGYLRTVAAFGPDGALLPDFVIYELR